jgi:hypothetical protein
MGKINAKKERVRTGETEGKERAGKMGGEAKGKAEWKTPSGRHRAGKV